MMIDSLPPGLRDDEIAAIEIVRRVARDVLAPAAPQVDEEAAFPRAQLDALAALGMLGMNLPEAWGGPGLSAMALAASVEAIAGACASTASAVTAHFLATDAILIGGDDTLRARYFTLAVHCTPTWPFPSPGHRSTP